MKQTINFGDFCDAFRAHDRHEQFSYEGKQAIFDYMEQYEADSGVELELDVIAICCDFNEDTWLDVARNYNIDIQDCEDDDEIRDTVRDYLTNHSQIVGETDNAVVYQVF